MELKQHLDSLSDELKQLAEQQTCPLDLEKYVRKLNDAKAKISVVGNILQSSQVCVELPPLGLSYVYRSNNIKFFILLNRIV